MFDRRKTLAVLVSMGGAVVSAVIGIPAFIAALSPAFKRRGEQWRSAGLLDDFPLGGIRPVLVKVGRDDWAGTLEEKLVYVWRPSETDAVVFSRNCTDLSCPLVFDPGSECFFCPCHGAIFGKDGQPMAGPPKDPLFRYAHRIRDGELEVDLHSLPPMS